MLRDISFAILFFMPAGAANVMPIFAAKLPWLKKYNAPVDGGRMWRGKRLLGDHKTWRGFITGIIASTLVFLLQKFIVARFVYLPSLDLYLHARYGMLPILIVGPLFGIGALGGDAIKSFFKRQLNFRPGASWFPFDQIDYIIGGSVALLPYIRLSIGAYAWLFVTWFILHIIATTVGYLLGLKDQPI